jgi:predicted phage-related endonuclease
MNQEQWDHERRLYIGGSEAFELLDQPQYNKGCKRALGYRKLGAEPDYPEQLPEDALLKRGVVLESLVAAFYEDQTGRKVRRPPSDNGYPRARIHPGYQWAGVHVDRQILAGSGGAETTGDLEIKTRSEGAWWRVKRLGAFPGDSLQVQWANFVTGHTWGALVTLGVFGSLPLLHFDVQANAGLHEVFKRVGEEFAEQVWGKGEPPAPTIDASDPRCKICAYRLTCRGEVIDQREAETMRQMERSKKNLVQIDNVQLTQTLTDLDILKQERKAIDESIDIAQKQALEIVGDVEGAIVRGYGKVYRLPAQYNGLDSGALEADKPEIYQKYYVHRLTGSYYLRTYPCRK